MASSFSSTLHTRPGNEIRTASTLPKGLHSLGLGETKDGLLYVPARLDSRKASPFLMMLHGAGGRANHAFAYTSFQNYADKTGTLLFAPDSRGVTWDVILGNYGPDVEFIDRALGHIFSQFAIDPHHVAIAGFSDGASYALSMGLSNGDLFTHILAFSPGFVVVSEAQEPFPKVYISHGVHDNVLSIDHCSRRIAPRLKKMNIDLTYREFEGEHTIPTKISNEALTWFHAPEEVPIEKTPETSRRPQFEGP